MIDDPILLRLGGQVSAWLVVFIDPPAPLKWWQRFLRPGFRHVLALGFDGRAWIQVDCAFNYLEVRSFREREIPLVSEVLRLRHAMALVVPARPVSRRVPPFPVYCVSVVKHAIGFKAWCLTPWGLYRRLCRDPDVRTISLSELQ